MNPFDTPFGDWSDANYNAAIRFLAGFAATILRGYRVAGMQVFSLPHDAEDCTSAFLGFQFPSLVKRIDPARGSFGGFIMFCFKRFVHGWAKKELRKRSPLVSLKQPDEDDETNAWETIASGELNPSDAAAFAEVLLARYDQERANQEGQDRLREAAQRFLPDPNRTVVLGRLKDEPVPYEILAEQAGITNEAARQQFSREFMKHSEAYLYKLDIYKAAERLPRPDRIVVLARFEDPKLPFEDIALKALVSTNAANAIWEQFQKEHAPYDG